MTIVASWEKFYQGGFASMHWGGMLAPLGLILAMSGWVIYRYRQTRAMTLAQFLEMRYSRRFRIFAGFLCFFSGVLNYGIFPAVTGRFLIYFLDLPIVASVLPGTALELNWTLGLVMAVLLGIALMITLNGGQIAVMVSDFLQGQLIYFLKYALFGWTFGVGFLGLTVTWVLGWMRTDDAWITWWAIHFSVIGVLGAVATVWFLWGGFKDLFALFRRLRTLVRDEDDDGTVEVHLGQPEDDVPDDTTATGRSRTASGSPGKAPE